MKKEKEKKTCPPDCKLLATFNAKGLEWNFVERNDGNGDYFLVYRRGEVNPSFIYSFNFLNGFCDEKKYNFIRRMMAE